MMAKLVVEQAPEKDSLGLPGAEAGGACFTASKTMEASGRETPKLRLSTCTLMVFKKRSFMATISRLCVLVKVISSDLRRRMSLCLLSLPSTFRYAFTEIVCGYVVSISTHNLMSGSMHDALPTLLTCTSLGCTRTRNLTSSVLQLFVEEEEEEGVASNSRLSRGRGGDVGGDEGKDEATICWCGTI